MKDNRQKFQLKVEQWSAKIDTLSTELQLALHDYEENLRGMSAKEKSVTEDLIDIRRKNLADFQKAAQEKAQKEELEMTQSVLDQMNVFIKTYGKENHYKMILSTSQYGNIAYADESLDLTQEVLSALNKKYKGE